MANNILITPGSASIQFSGSAANSIRLQVEPSGGIAFYGNSGTLFGITDNLSGSLMSVNDISGLPILEVFSDDKVVMGSFNTNAFVITGSKVGVGTSTPSTKFHLYDTSANSPTILVENSSTYTNRFGLSGNTGSIGSSNATPLGIMTNGSNRIWLDTAGGIGIGTTLTGAKILSVYGTNADHLSTFTYAGSTNTAGAAYFTNTSTAAIATKYGILSVVEGANGTSNIAGYFSAQNGSNNYAAVFVNGKVGIGITAPTALLQVSSSANSSWATQISNGGSTNAHGLYVLLGSTSTGVPFRVDKASTTYFSITNAGDVGIGTTAPGTKLEVSGNVSASSFTSSLISGVGYLGTASMAISASYAPGGYTPSAGIVSSSTQFKLLTDPFSGSFTGSHIGTLTGNASTATALQTARLINGTSFDGSSNIIITGSYSTLSNIPIGLVSSSTQASGWTVTTATGNAGTATTLQTARLINGTSFNGSANIIITASYSTLDNIPVGLVSSSTQASGWTVTTATGNAGTATTLQTARLINGTSFNGSANIIITGSYTTLSSIPIGIVSSSTQTSGWSAATLTTARLINGTSFDGSANIIITGSYITLSGIPIGIVSSSGQVAYTGLSSIPVGIVSSSTQASTWGVDNAVHLTTARLINGTSFDGTANIIITGSYTTLSNIPTGIMSSSAQTVANIASQQITPTGITGSITGSLTSTSSFGALKAVRLVAPVGTDLWLTT